MTSVRGARPPALELRGVRAGYGRINVLHDVDLLVPAGTVMALLGPNGAGKTTTLSVAAGKLAATAGHLHVGGQHVNGASAASMSRAGVCRIPEGRGIFPTLTVAENLRLITFVGKKVSADEVAEITYARFPVLKERRSQLAGTMSGGEQQMLAMARALGTHPGLLLLDEISMGLAPKIVAALYEIVGQLAADGISVLLVEQFAHTALAVADYAALMVGGRIVRVGQPDDVAGALNETYLGGWRVKRFIALPLAGLCFLPVSAEAAEPGSGLISYSMSANAPGVAIEGLYRDVAFTTPETTSTLSTGGVGAGLASLAWPGPIVGNAGTTILVLEASAPPQVTVLNDPVRAESRSGGAQKASYTTLPGTVMQSTATHTQASASSVTGATGLPIGDVGAFHGSSSVSFTGSNTALADAKSVMQDVSLAAGVIKIGSITSTAHATNDGLTGTTSGSTVVAGMSIAGVPVSVDENGLHVQSTVLNPVSQQTVTNAVKALGLTVLLTQPRALRSGSTVSENAGALVLMYAQGSSTYALTIGRASVALTSSRAPAQPTFPTPTLPGVTAPGPGPVGQPPAISAGQPPVSGVLPPAVTPPAPTGVAGVIHSVQAAVVSLAGGASALAVVGLMLFAGMLVFGLKLLPDHVLEVSTSDCEEWPA